MVEVVHPAGVCRSWSSERDRANEFRLQFGRLWYICTYCVRGFPLHRFTNLNPTSLAVKSVHTHRTHRPLHLPLYPLGVAHPSRPSNPPALLPGVPNLAANILPAGVIPLRPPGALLNLGVGVLPGVTPNSLNCPNLPPPFLRPTSAFSTSLCSKSSRLLRSSIRKGLGPPSSI